MWILSHLVLQIIKWGLTEWCNAQCKQSFNTISRGRSTLLEKKKRQDDFSPIILQIWFFMLGTSFNYFSIHSIEVIVPYVSMFTFHYMWHAFLEGFIFILVSTVTLFWCCLYLVLNVHRLVSQVLALASGCVLSTYICNFYFKISKMYKTNTYEVLSDEWL